MNTIAYIGIGANLGDARANVADAIERLRRLDGCALLAVSSLYRSAPIDTDGDDYINAVARITTTLDAEALLQALRGFVLVPLLELAPAIAIPGLGPAQQFAAAVADQGISTLSSSN